jgi:hypothetical protein
MFLMIGIGIEELAILLIPVYLIIWIVAFVDIMGNQFRGDEKLYWLLAVILVPLVGLICYLYFGRKQKVSTINNRQGIEN